MVFKWIINNNWKILVVIIIFIILFIFLFLSANSKINIIFDFDNVISYDTRQNISDIILKKNKLYALDLFKELKSYFPALSFVSVLYNPILSNIKIGSDKPYLTLTEINNTEINNLNKKYILTKNGIIAEQDLFTISSCDNLYNLYINSDNFFYKNNLEIFVSFALSLSLELLEKFDITWQSKTEIIFKLCSNQSIEIITDAKVTNLEEKISWAKKIYKNKKKKEGLKLDIRFRDLIICVPLGGEGEL